MQALKYNFVIYICFFFLYTKREGVKRGQAFGYVSKLHVRPDEFCCLSPTHSFHDESIFFGLLSICISFSLIILMIKKYYIFNHMMCGHDLNIIIRIWVDKRVSSLSARTLGSVLR